MKLGANREEVAPPRVAASAATRGRRLKALLGRQPLGVAGGLVVALLVFLALLAPLVAPYGPLEMRIVDRLNPPSPQHWMGTDEFGRDVLSRIIYGSQISLYVGLLSVALGGAVGAVVGLVSGYSGGMLDVIVQRLIDSLMVFPTIVLGLALMAALGSSINNVVYAVAIVMVPRVARVVRGATLSIKEKQYVEAARAVGCRDRRIMLQHIAPNVLAPVIVVVSAQLGIAILAEASLSFLGLGVPPPAPSWGGMLSGAAQKYFEDAPWLATFPGLAISLVVLGFNLLGDSLRDVWDPRLRRGT